MGSAKIGTVRSKGDNHRVPVKGQTLDRKQSWMGGTVFCMQTEYSRGSHPHTACMVDEQRQARQVD